MSEQRNGYYISGYTEENKKFRPSDWVERLASVYATFDARQRLCYHPMIRPVFHDDARGLFVDSRLADTDAAAFQLLMEFARSNSLRSTAEGTAMIEFQAVA